MIDADGHSAFHSVDTSGGRREMTKKTAVVTGAGSGIGRAVAVALLREGYTVALCGRRAERLEETANEAGASSATRLVIPTDVTDAPSVSKLFDTVGKQF